LNSNQYTFIKEKIINSLKIEADSLYTLCHTVNDEMCAAIELIYKSNGRVILTGIGKSALVAQKIVATLNSTGTQSVFMHAADAIHGDIGMLSENDVVICLSKSGDTPEIKVLVPLIKNFGNSLIAIVSNENSFLALQSDICIYLPMEKEADPNNLAPTTSTILQMAMGDAIAVALLSLKGFTEDQFARFHPGGSLGKQLYLKVRDLIVRNEKPKVYLTDPIKKVISEISGKRLGATAVMDDNENLQGIITDGDLRRMMERTDDFVNIQAGDIMSGFPKTISIDNLAVDAFAMMKKHSITQLVVMEENRYKGMVHIHDMMREGII
jgi:arabinose-5-phosphate isomerase